MKEVFLNGCAIASAVLILVVVVGLLALFAAASVPHSAFGN